MEGLCAGDGEAGGSPGDRQGPDGVSGAGSGVSDMGEESLGAEVGPAAAGLMAVGLELTVTGDAAALPGLGAVGGPRGFGDTGGGTRFDSGQGKYQRQTKLTYLQNILKSAQSQQGLMCSFKHNW